MAVVQKNAAAAVLGALAYLLRVLGVAALLTLIVLLARHFVTRVFEVSRR